MQVFAPESGTFASQSATFDLQNGNFCILKGQLWGGQSSTFARQFLNFHWKRVAFYCYYSKTIHLFFQNWKVRFMKFSDIHRFINVLYFLIESWFKNKFNFHHLYLYKIKNLSLNDWCPKISWIELFNSGKTNE